MRLDQRPSLVIVSGAAASGKTTLATAIADELRLPLLVRDAFKEALMDTLRSPDRARSRVLGAASYAVLFVALDRLLDAGVGAVIESNFSHGIAERELAERVSCSRAVQVHCHTTPAVIRRRYAERAGGGRRHAGHHDTDPQTIADLEASLASSRHEPLDLGVPLLTVDTSDGYTPSFDEIRAFITS